MNEIILAAPEDFPRVRAFYHSLIDEMQSSPYLPGWKKEIYPSDEDLTAALDRSEMYLLTANGEIAGAMAVNCACNEEYDRVSWPTAAAQGEFLVIHMLGVHPRFSGRGLAKAMVAHALNLGRAARMKAVRLDVLEGNLPAERLYSGAGFQYVDTVEMFYEDTGRVRFRLYELTL